MENLMEGLINQMNRVRKIIKEYESLFNNAGVYIAGNMKREIERTEKAIGEGDTIEMLLCYSNLSEIEPEFTGV